MRKKHHTGLWITLGVIACLIAAPIVFVFGFIYDGTTVEVNATNKEPDQIFMDSVSSSMDDTKNTGKINIKVTEADLNGVLKLAANSIPPEAKDFVKQFYVDINPKNSTYNFYLEANAFGFKTRLKIECSLEQILDNDNPQNNAFVFKLKDVLVGKVGGLWNIAKLVAGDYISDDFLNNFFSQAGLSIKSDLKNNAITYKVKDMFNDLNAKIGGSLDGTYMEMLPTMFNQFIDNKLINFDFYKNDALNTEFDLSPLHDSEMLTKDKDLSLSLGQYRENTVTCLNKSIITVEQADNFFQYLVRGYDGVNPDIQSMVSNLGDLSIIGIDDKATYPGDSELASDKDLNKMIIDQIDPMELITNHHIATIDENDINEIIIGTPIIGSGSLLKSSTKKGEETEYKVSYLSIDTIYANIFSQPSKDDPTINDNFFNLTIRISVNGYPTYITVCFKENPETRIPYGIQFNLHEMYFGNLTVGNDVKTLIFKMMHDTLNGFSSALQFDNANQTFTVSLEDQVQASGYKDQIDSIGSLIIKTKGTTLNELGAFEFDIQPK